MLSCILRAMLLPNTDNMINSYFPRPSSRRSSDVHRKCTSPKEKEEIVFIFGLSLHTLKLQYTSMCLGPCSNSNPISERLP